MSEGMTDNMTKNQEHVPVNSSRKQRGWPKGVSGNPAGKPPGTRHRATLAVEALLAGEADKLTRKCVEMALDGDTTALRLCFERLAPPPKDRPIAFSIPPAATASEINLAMGKVIEAVGEGTITPAEGNALVGLLDAHRKGIETSDLETRIERLEKETKDKGKKP